MISFYIDIVVFFNPRALYGRDDFALEHYATTNLFAPTHAPHARCDQIGRVGWGCYRDFNPRVPHGTRLVAQVACAGLFVILAHAPCMGRDKRILFYAMIRYDFQPTRPMRARHGNNHHRYI